MNPARTVRLGLSRVRYEVVTYFRQGDSVFFTFLFPLIMMTIFSVAFSESSFGRDADGNDVSAAAYYLPGMLAAGVLLSGLQNMSIDIAVEKGDGTLKRLAGSPLPVFSYFVGKIGQVLVTGLLQAALLLLVARLLLGAAIAGSWAFAISVTSRLVPDERLGRALTVVNTGTTVATVAAMPLGAYLGEVWGWRSADT